MASLDAPTATGDGASSGAAEGAAPPAADDPLPSDDPLPPGEGAPLGRGRSSQRSIVAIGALAVLLGLLAAAVWWPAAGELPGITRDPAPTVEGLVFLDHREPGAPVTTDLVAPPDGLLLAYFGYMSCPDVCPLTMADIARAQGLLGPELAARTTVAFVTLDPDRDDPERMRAYLGHFFDTGDQRALTAPDDASLQAATDRLGVQWEVEPHEPGDDRYHLAHSAITYVIDERGTVVRELPFGASSEEFAQVLRGLLP
jgi:cytochrome oxidase Cu insertion factor (SCO1/SenC/PrrC family)